MVDLAPAPTETRRRPSPAAILAVVGFSVFVAADDLTVVATMLRPIIGDLGLVLPDGLDDAADALRDVGRVPGVTVVTSF